MKIFNKLLPLSAITIALLGSACSDNKDNKDNNQSTHAAQNNPVSEVNFTSEHIIDDAKYFWAHTPKDVTGDGIADLVFINNNASGGFLGYYQGQKESGKWQKHIIAQIPPTGGLFAGGDLESSDVDGDGDNDVIGIKHPGEWNDAGATAELFWYENQGDSWKAHTIGTAPDAVKDVSFADFDNDGLKDLAILTFDSHTLSIYKQVTADNWKRVQFIQDKTLHEGMDVGDFNQDGYLDIVATGYIFSNPKGQLEQPWHRTNLDPMWNNQTGDWSRNGTKTFATEINGEPNIFMCHSERAGYPLIQYRLTKGEWQATEIMAEVPACHTLQVFDFNLDNQKDILVGINWARAVNLEQTNFDVSLLLADGEQWKKQVIDTQGIYNGQAIDFDSDGDMDFFRYPNHEATDLYLFENQSK